MAERKGNNRGGKRSETASIVIRREEIIESGHHGGAWKVAYADFVTAMMAFFLLMWLINAISEDQRRGIAAYFNPMADRTLAGGGSGVLPSEPTPYSQGSAVAAGIEVAKSSAAQTAISPGTHPDSPSPPAGGPPLAANGSTSASLDAQATTGGQVIAPTGIAGSGGAADGQDGVRPGHLAGDEGQGAGAKLDRGPGGAQIVQAVMLHGPALLAGAKTSDEPRDKLFAGGDLTANRAAAAELREALAHDPAVADSLDQVDVQATPDELRVQIMDASGKPMFEVGRAVPNPRAVALLRRIAPYLARLGGPVSIAGHTDATPYVAGQVSNWTLSSARADAAEQILVGAGLPEANIAEVTGYAGREPVAGAKPDAATNRRIVLSVRRPAETRPAPTQAPALAPALAPAAR